MDEFLEKKDFCPLCRKPFETNQEEHEKSDAHKYNLIIHYNETNREELSKDKLGVSLRLDWMNEGRSKLEYHEKIGQYSLNVNYTDLDKIKHLFEFKCIFHNTTKETVKITEGKILEGRGVMIDIVDDKWLESEIEVSLKKESEYSNIFIEFDLRDVIYGKHSIPFAFNLRIEGEDVLISRTIVIAVTKDVGAKPWISEDRRVLNPRTVRRWFINKITGPVKERISNKDFLVDEEKVEYMITNFKEKEGGDENTDKLKETEEVMRNGLTLENYREYFHNCLWLEEKLKSIEVKSLFLERIPAQVTREGFLSFRVFHVTRRRTHLCPGNIILLRVHGSAEAFEGYVREFYAGNVIVHDIDDKFLRSLWNRRPLIDVQFQYERLPMSRKHKGVELVVQKLHVAKLFPDSLPFEEQEPKYNLIFEDFLNKDVANNPEQRTAVVNILNSSSRAAPYIVFGPPGTGKTVTIVEAICQIIRKTKRKVLVCAPANAHCDMLALKLMKYCRPEELCRAYSRCRKSSAIPEKLVQYSNTNNKRGINRLKATHLNKYRIVISTLVFIGKFDDFVYSPDYLFIDEAAQAIEPETCIALSRLNTAGHLILAGDPKQLKPIVKSGVAKKFGLDISLLERLLETQKVYQNEDPKFITMLKRNYRSHPLILEISNQLFYENKVTCESSQDPVSSLNVFPQIGNTNEVVSGHALEFCAVSAEESKESMSTSFFNLDEIWMLIKYIQTLLEVEITPQVTKDDIGIISPYNSQVHKIKELLKKDRLSDVEVGTIESFQGREKRVILMSTVRGQYDLLKYDNRYGLGFLKEPQRFNVAITRATSKLVIIGCPIVLSTDEKWNAFIKTCLRLNTYYGVEPEEQNEKKYTTCIEKFSRFPTLLRELEKPRKIRMGKSKCILEYLSDAAPPTDLTVPSAEETNENVNVLGGGQSSVEATNSTNSSSLQFSIEETNSANISKGQSSMEKDNSANLTSAQSSSDEINSATTHSTNNSSVQYSIEETNSANISQGQSSMEKDNSANLPLAQSPTDGTNSANVSQEQSSIDANVSVGQSSMEKDNSANLLLAQSLTDETKSANISQGESSIDANFSLGESSMKKDNSTDLSLAQSPTDETNSANISQGQSSIDANASLGQSAVIETNRNEKISDSANGGSFDGETNSSSCNSSEFELIDVEETDFELVESNIGSTDCASGSLEQSPVKETINASGSLGQSSVDETKSASSSLRQSSVEETKSVSGSLGQTSVKRTNSGSCSLGQSSVDETKSSSSSLGQSSGKRTNSSNSSFGQSAVDEIKSTSSSLGQSSGKRTNSSKDSFGQSFVDETKSTSSSLGQSSVEETKSSSSSLGQYSGKRTNSSNGSFGQSSVQETNSASGSLGVSSDGKTDKCANIVVSNTAHYRHHTVYCYPSKPGQLSTENQVKSSVEAAKKSSNNARPGHYTVYCYPSKPAKVPIVNQETPDSNTVGGPSRIQEAGPKKVFVFDSSDSESGSSIEFFDAEELSSSLSNLKID